MKNKKFIVRGSVFDNIPPNANLCIITGSNGSGKTRVLEELSNNTLNDLRSSTSNYDRMICLSGTVLDKFPQESAELHHKYVYFGRKINNNMFSEISPFRRLAFFLLTDATNSEYRAVIAKDFLSRIGFSSEITLNFRRGRNSKEKLLSSSSDDLDINFTLDHRIHEHNNLSERLGQLKLGLIHLSSMSFVKKERKIELMDLSSGERAYILTILALTFGTIDRTLVLFDEPENSLHPKWQSTIMKDIWTAISMTSKKSRAIIATHSPLVVSGATNDYTYICDLELQSKWTRSDMHGNTSDSILKNQFGLQSPRTISALSLIQKCLNAVVTIETDPNTFRIAADDLLRLNLYIDVDDPLYMTIEKIKELRKGIE
jgi:predicted ATPase